MLFPAHAGVILNPIACQVSHFTFPRTRGGDPSIVMMVMRYVNFSPHTRG